MDILYTLHMPKFYMPTFGNRRNNSKTAPISLYFVRLAMVGKPGFTSNSVIFSATNNYVTTPHGLTRDTLYVPHPNWLCACKSCISMLTRRCPMGREMWTNLGRFRSISFPISKTNTWCPTDRSIGQKLNVLTLQSYNPTSYSINAYTFMANTTFNWSFCLRYAS